MEFVAPVQETKAKVKSFIGHKDRTFDLRLSAARKQLLSASEDGSCKVWDVETKKCALTIVHNKAVEVLRAAFLDSVEGGICTAGADGNAVIWREEEEEGGSRKARKVHVLEHGAESQIYVCETMQKCSDLLVAADNRMIVWDLHSFQASRIYQFNAEATQESFGGHRNPDNAVFVFDAKSQPDAASMVGATMSDSTVRLIDMRCEQASAQVVALDLQQGLGGIKLGHATSINWSAGGSDVAVALGSGLVALLDWRMPSVRALLHSHAGPCYGAIFAGGSSSGSSSSVSSGSSAVPNLDSSSSSSSSSGSSPLITWSSDCTIRIWDAAACQGLCERPASIIRLADFPMLSGAWDAQRQSLICGGGGSGGTFMGTPIHEVDLSGPLSTLTLH
ncbi:WD40-repeat-containing domain protein [Ochromonadaceae sp. CCMP2298]|nr:WD40-repeat-containing domain protein [Ochromonadaceae sp. CCMP2298]